MQITLHRPNVNWRRKSSVTYSPFSISTRAGENPFTGNLWAKKGNLQESYDNNNKSQGNYLESERYDCAEFFFLPNNKRSEGYYHRSTFIPLRVLWSYFDDNDNNNNNIDNNNNDNNNNDDYDNDYNNNHNDSDMNNDNNDNSNIVGHPFLPLHNLRVETVTW